MENANAATASLNMTVEAAAAAASFAAASGCSLAGENFTAVQRIESTETDRGFLAILCDKNCRDPELAGDYGIDNLPGNEMVEFLEGLMVPAASSVADPLSTRNPAKTLSKKFAFLQVVQRGWTSFKLFRQASERCKMVVPLSTYLRLLKFFRTESWGKIVGAAQKEMRRNTKLQLEGGWICKDIYHSFYWVFEELGKNLDLALQIGTTNCVGVSLLYLNKEKVKVAGAGEVSLDLFLVEKISAGQRSLGELFLPAVTPENWLVSMSSLPPSTAAPPRKKPQGFCRSAAVKAAAPATSAAVARAVKVVRFSEVPPLLQQQLPSQPPPRRQIQNSETLSQISTVEGIQNLAAMVESLSADSLAASSSFAATADASLPDLMSFLEDGENYSLDTLPVSFTNDLSRIDEEPWRKEGTGEGGVREIADYLENSVYPAEEAQPAKIAAKETPPLLRRQQPFQQQQPRDPGAPLYGSRAGAAFLKGEKENRPPLGQAPAAAKKKLSLLDSPYSPTNPSSSAAAADDHPAAASRKRNVSGAVDEAAPPEPSYTPTPTQPRREDSHQTYFSSAGSYPLTSHESAKRNKKSSSSSHGPQQKKGGETFRKTSQGTVAPFAAAAATTSSSTHLLQKEKSFRWKK